MLGAIAGDVIGSIYEHRQAARWDFPLFHPRCRFTDDSVLTVATADALLSGASYESKYREYYRLYPDAGYGGRFIQWGQSDTPQSYGSFGNGSAMRVSPVAYTSDDLETVLSEAARSAECTHNHPEGIKGAQAVAAAIFWARQGCSKEAIQLEIEGRFGYDLSRTVKTYHQYGEFDVTCQGSVPQALIAFLEGDNFESTLRNAIYIGGDSDTVACMAGSIAEAYYGGVPRDIREFVFNVLDERLAGIVTRFRARFIEPVKK